MTNFGDPSGQWHVGGRRRDTHTADKVLTHGHTLQYCRVPKNGLPKNGQAGISPKNKNDPGWRNELRTVYHTQRAFAVKTTFYYYILFIQ